MDAKRYVHQPEGVARKVLGVQPAALGHVHAVKVVHHGCRLVPLSAEGGEGGAIGSQALWPFGCTVSYEVWRGQMTHRLAGMNQAVGANQSIDLSAIDLADNNAVE